MPARAERGFTLLEVLIALVIAALALGLLFSGALAGLRSSTLSAHYQEAVSRANSHMAVIGHGVALTPGPQSGADGGGFTWRTSIRPVGAAPMAGSALTRPSQVVLYGVTVSISWSMDGGPRTVTLESERVAVRAPAGP